MEFDKEKVRKLLNNMDRVSKTSQEFARNRMDDEPGQRIQNTYWRYIMQDVKELKKILLV